MAAHALGEELLPAVTILGHGRVGVCLAERGDVGLDLLVGCVDARRRGVEEALDSSLAGGHQHVGVDEHGQHARGLVELDEAHATHVGREVEHLLDAVDGGPARGDLAEVEREVLRARVDLVPLAEGLDIGGAYLVAAAEKIGDQPTSDEPATARDEHARTGARGTGDLGGCFSSHDAIP